MPPICTVLAHSGNTRLRALPAKGQEERFLKAQNLQSSVELARSDRLKLPPLLPGVLPQMSGL